MGLTKRKLPAAGGSPRQDLKRRKIDKEVVAMTGIGYLATDRLAEVVIGEVRGGSLALFRMPD